MNLIPQSTIISHVRLRTRQAGFTLIELLIAMAISLLASVAIFTVMSNSEGTKRSTTSVNDINQSGAFAVYTLDRMLRSAGAGFGQSWAKSYGCKLNATLTQTSAVTLLPAASSNFSSSAFSTLVSTNSGIFRMAPIVIASSTENAGVGGSSGSSDNLIIMGGNSGYGEIPTKFTSPPTSNTLNVRSSFNFKPSDLILISDNAVSGYSGPGPCMIQQVSSSFTTGGAATAITLAGNYYAAAGNDITLGGTTNYTNAALVSDLGNPGTSSAARNAPNFWLVGVGANNVLVMNDLLQVSGSGDIPITDGVYELHAVYGVDSNDDGTIDTWIRPDSGTSTVTYKGTTYDYSFAGLTNGSTTSATALRLIKAIRIGLIMRTSLLEKTQVTSSTMTLFSDLSSPVTLTRTMSSAEQYYRYRTIETTIPIRNNMVLFAPPVNNNAVKAGHSLVTF